MLPAGAVQRPKKPGGSACRGRKSYRQQQKTLVGQMQAQEEEGELCCVNTPVFTATAKL
jgi:hypothetical protein